MKLKQLKLFYETEDTASLALMEFKKYEAARQHAEIHHCHVIAYLHDILHLDKNVEVAIATNTCDKSPVGHCVHVAHGPTTILFLGTYCAFCGQPGL